ncbi:hypothetical protein GTR02_21010 [Kineococcus sp. R8]|uniref:hypothetical protein n=1 Tax=Kineococcus siccus TaxID=2696567 RepID=UPI001413709E|nr:hypothetical protein [Kineococcus siccus]NAZ84287.1 hypothetical protein [Kineococcus siccus]
MSTSATASTTAALAALVAVAAFAPSGLLTVAVVLVGLLVAVGWSPLLDLPSRRGTAAVVALAAAAAAVTVVLRTATGEDPLTVLPAAAALALLLAFVHQLLRRDGRPRLVESVTGSVTGQSVVVLAAAWVALPGTVAGAAFAAVVLSALAASAAVCAVGWPLRVAGPVSLVAGAAAGWLASGLAALLGAGDVVSDVRWSVAGVVAGLGAGLLSASWRAHSERLPGVHGLSAALAVAAAPVAMAGAGAYVVGRLLLG